MTNTQTAQDLKSRIATQLDEGFVHRALGKMPQIGATAEEISKAETFSNIKDKEAYLTWVAQYRVLIKEIEAHIRSLKTKRFDDDMWVRADADSEHHWFALAATALIHMRRLGKVWSAAEARAKLEEAA